MVRSQLWNRGISSPSVLKAMLQVERHRFVPPSLQPLAYSDQALPLENNQTISQPYVVAYACQMLNLTKKKKVLEVGTGSGYQTAILSLLSKEVYTVEIIPEFVEQAKKIFLEQGISNVFCKTGNGLLGWPEKAPFQAIVISASVSKIPEALLAQLDREGRMIAPVGDQKEQVLTLFEKMEKGEFKKTKTIPVVFVSARTN